ncbi:hypothetical protein ACLB1G_05965 [Oxalobacteraceae bacterium A2-2]
MNSAQDKDKLEARLRERLLLGRAAPGDRLMLADATLLAALAGSRPLTPNERDALQQSPLTLRRFRQLALERRAAARPGTDGGGEVGAGAQPATEAGGQGSAGSQPATEAGGLGSAGSQPATEAGGQGGAHLRPATDINRQRGAGPLPATYIGWQGSAGMLRAAASGAALAQLVTDDGHWTLDFVREGEGWSVILALSPQAPFAAQLLRAQPLLRVMDGGGAIVLQGRLDADGECERPWTLAAEPAAHFHLYGATFAVEPAVSGP